jgi:hypothetical protein
VDETTERLQETLRLLEQVGGPLAGPWMYDEDRLRGQARPDSPKGIRDFFEDSFKPDEWYDGYNVRLWRGLETDTLDRGIITVQANVKPGPRNLGRFILDGYDGALTVLVRTHALSLTSALARIWSPDMMVCKDWALSEAESELILPWRRTLAPEQKRYAWPQWGYISCLSDAVAPDLEHVDGAQTTRLGGGWLVVLDDQTPQGAAAVWQPLFESGRIGPIPAQQTVLPTFD